MSAAIELRGVSHLFENTRVLDRVSFTVEPGEILAVVGPSGCGKSTVLNLIAGFLKPTSGDVLVGEQRIDGPGPDRGVCFQEHALYPWLSVLENVLFGPKAQGRCDGATRRRADEILDHFGLAAFRSFKPAELSGGMRQRAAIARLLVNNPSVLLMDEPFGALDAQTRLRMQEFLIGVQWEFKSTVLFITHDVDEAIYLGHRVLVMGARPGRIAEIYEVGQADGPRERSFLVGERFRQLKAGVLAHLMQDAPALH